MTVPKTDAVVKLELNTKEQQTRLITIENKENIPDGNLFPVPIRPVIIPVNRPKNDVRINYIYQDEFS